MYDLTAALASTKPKIEKKWQDNLSTKTPLMFKLKEKGGMILEAGGTELKYPVILGKGKAKSYYGNDVLDIGRPEGLNALSFDWKQFYSSITIDGIEEIQNAGPEKGPDLLEGRIKQSEITTMENFEEMLFGDGAGNVGGDGVARDWNGLQNLVADDPTTGTIGGLSRAGNPLLQNQVNSTSVSSFNTSQNGRSALTSLWASCIKGSRKPNYMPTTVAIWTLYQLSLTANERYLIDSDKGLTSAGFPNVAFMTAPVTMSDQCPADHFYMLRIAKPKTDGGIFLIIHKDRNFKMRDFIPARDQDTTSALVLTAGQLGTDAPYLNGVATTITG